MMVVSASSGFGSQRRWAILLTFMLNCGFNAFMFMDFTSVPTLTKQVFGFCPLENATACTELGEYESVESLPHSDPSFGAHLRCKMAEQAMISSGGRTPLACWRSGARTSHLLGPQGCF